MHKQIKKYSIEGTTEEHRLIKTREDMIRVLEMQAQDDGCLPHLEINPVYTVSYNEHDETFSFQLSIYAVYVGRKKALEYEGFSHNKAVGRKVYSH